MENIQIAFYLFLNNFVPHLGAAMGWMIPILGVLTLHNSIERKHRKK